MSEIKSRADLFEAAAKMMRMCDEAGVRHVFKLGGEIVTATPSCKGNPSDYEFPLAIVEGKPVFKGDELYDEDGDKQIAPWVYCPVRKIKFPMEFPANHSWSWLLPKPKPPIPPELSEVMRERDELKRKLSESFSPEDVKELQDLARQTGAEEARKVPEGWKLVPIEPTDNGVGGMVNAGAIALKQHDDTPFMENRTGIAKFVYEAMLSAAPQSHKD